MSPRGSDDGRASLSTVLAELEATISFLASGMRESSLQTTADDISNLSPVRQDASTCSSDTSFLRAEQRRVPSAACQRQPPSHLSPQEASCELSEAHDAASPVIHHVPLAQQVHRSLGESPLQSTIADQLRMFEDISEDVDNACEELQSDAFSDVTWIHHARALPCNFCARLFFQRSLRFHEEQCKRRFANEVVNCPRCLKEVCRADLPKHALRCSQLQQLQSDVAQSLQQRSGTPGASAPVGAATPSPGKRASHSCRVSGFCSGYQPLDSETLPRMTPPPLSRPSCPRVQVQRKKNSVSRILPFDAYRQMLDESAQASDKVCKRPPVRCHAPHQQTSYLGVQEVGSFHVSTTTPVQAIMPHIEEIDFMTPPVVTPIKQYSEEELESIAASVKEQALSESRRARADMMQKGYVLSPGAESGGHRSPDAEGMASCCRPGQRLQLSFESASSYSSRQSDFRSRSMPSGQTADDARPSAAAMEQPRESIALDAYLAKIKSLRSGISSPLSKAVDMLCHESSALGDSGAIDGEPSAGKAVS
eukprot:TRINITY_DN13341_c0_g1_i1.p1 TRINITY_DN13341_c0_g1~~TRINITY_DN13341_c0_g1_i1.p1  ORF type:complete len:537 (-),score=71.08 TRINITY_DN13341_c0_g1_i1:222-1832(-)